MAGYFLKPDSLGPKTSYFRKIIGFSDDWMLEEGDPMGEELPSTVQIQMNNQSGFSQGTEIAPILYTAFSGLVVERSVRDVILAHDSDGVEFFDCEVLDRKGKRIKTAYYLLNTLRKYDCIDRERTSYEVDDEDDEDEYFDKVVNLRLLENKVPNEAAVYRIDRLQKWLVVGEALLEEIRQIATRGYRVAAVSGFDQTAEPWKLP